MILLVKALASGNLSGNLSGYRKPIRIYYIENGIVHLEKIGVQSSNLVEEPVQYTYHEAGEQRLLDSRSFLTDPMRGLIERA